MATSGKQGMQWQALIFWEDSTMCNSSAFSWVKDINCSDSVDYPVFIFTIQSQRWIACMIPKYFYHLSYLKTPQRESKCIGEWSLSPCILNLGTRWGRVISFLFHALCHRSKNSPLPFNWIVCRVRLRPGWTLWWRRNPLHYRESTTSPLSRSHSLHKLSLSY
jgi:hypothetical protein